MSRRARAIVSLAAAAVAAVTIAGFQPSVAAPPDKASPTPTKPDKVVIIVVDSLSKEIVDKYGMDNVQAMMADGVDTPRATSATSGRSPS